MKPLLLLIVVALLWGGNSLPLQAQENKRVITAENLLQLELIETIGRGAVVDVQWSPDGEWLGVLTTRGVWLYSQTDWTIPPLTIGVDDHLPAFTSFTFSPTQAEIITGHSDGSIRWWSSVTAELLATVH